MTEEQVFLAALELPDRAARTAYLDKACGGDAEFRRQVDDLLVAHFQSGDFLDEPLGKQMGAGAATPINGNTASLYTNLGADAAVAETKPDEEADDLHFLQQSTRPDSLGRIGHYEVLQVLGKGGFGIVFRAFDEQLQRVVAIKVLDPQLAVTSPARKRFLREAQASAKVRHENVVQVYAVEEEPLPYLVMEFVPGETLQQRLDRTGPLEAMEVVRLGRQIAEGLAAAHGTGLIHRDIKPANILIEAGSNRRLKITDFGLARAADDASLSQSGLIAGTPMFMAPEQAQGDALDHRADLFSLGSVLYAICSGRPPFRANSTLAVLRRVAEDTPRPIAEIIPEAPQRLCEIIARLQAKKPEDRFQSAREAADALTDCEAQLKADAKLKDFSRIPQSKPAAGRSGRWKWVAAAALLLPVLALALTEITGVTHLLQQNRQPTPEPQASGDRPKDKEPPTDLTKQHQQPTPPALMSGDPDYTNTLGMKLKPIPAGKFTMGSSQQEIGRCLGLFDGEANAGWVTALIWTEEPQHEVEITQPFYMGATEVTVRQFRQFIEGNPNYNVGDDRWNRDLVTFCDHPVLFVSWQNAVDFCNWLSVKEGKKYRLPTEAEWEYCCRAGKSETRYCYGDDDAQLENYAWYRTNSGGETHPVGMKKPNDWGLYDMHGNAFEWCQDWYGSTYYKNSPATDPMGPGDGSWHVTRGGGFNSDPPVICRSAFRNYGASGFSYDTGFRVLLEAPPGGFQTESAAKDKPPRPAIAAFSDADVKRIAALPAAPQLEEVRTELMRRNPDFDGALTPTIEDGVVTGLEFRTDRVTDISPVRALTQLQSLKIPYGRGLTDLGPLKGMRLKQLSIEGTGVTDLTPLQGMPLEWLMMWGFIGSDLTPLQGMPLKWLNCGGGGQKLDLTPLAGLPLDFLCINFTQTSDLTPLKDAPLTTLLCSNTPVSDLTPLRGRLLKHLQVFNTNVPDLSPLKGMPLEWLECQGAGVTDLSPLKDLPLTALDCDFQPERDAKILHAVKTLETINGKPAAEFWKEVDGK